MGSLVSSQASASQEDRPISHVWRTGAGAGAGVGVGAAGAAGTAGAVGAGAGTAGAARARYLDSSSLSVVRLRGDQGDEREGRLGGGRQETERASCQAGARHLHVSLPHRTVPTD